MADVVASTELPEALRSDPALYAGCMAGAFQLDEFQTMLEDAGFRHIRIQPKDEARGFIRYWAPGRGVEDYGLAATIEAAKPR